MFENCLLSFVVVEQKNKVFVDFDFNMLVTCLYLSFHSVSSGLVFEIFSNKGCSQGHFICIRGLGKVSSTCIQKKQTHLHVTISMLILSTCISMFGDTSSPTIYLERPLALFSRCIYV